MGSAGASGESCYVCGGFKSVAQAHHVIPLNEQFDRGFETPNHDHERLCPTQHVVLHLWIDDDISDHEGRRRAGRPSATYLTPNLAVTLNSPAGVVSSAASRVS